jgi:hypothetical protein
VVLNAFSAYCFVHFLDTHNQVKSVDDNELKLKYFKLLLAGVRDRQSTKATIWSALVRTSIYLLLSATLARSVYSTVAQNTSS